MRHARPKRRRYRWLIAPVSAILMLSGGIAYAAQVSQSLSAGDSVVVKCDGSKLAWSRQSQTQMTLKCGGKTATPTPTSPSPTPTSTGAAGNCAPPYIYTTSQATGTINTDPGADEFWWVDNDAWSGSHGPQTLQVCSNQSWNAVSNQPNIGGQVETYPNTEFDVGGRNNGTPTKTIGQYNSITSTYHEAFPASGWSGDAAYDLWMNNWNQEIMIWNEVTGTQAYWATCTGCGESDVTIAGVNYRHINWGVGQEQAFIQKNQTKSGTVDLLAVLKYLVNQNLLKNTDVPTQLEYGVEICSTSGTQTFSLTGLSFSLS